MNFFFIIIIIYVSVYLSRKLSDSSLFEIGLSDSEGYFVVMVKKRKLAGNLL